MRGIRKYYWLAKPGIVYSNVIAAIAGFFFASTIVGRLDIVSFLATVGGMGFVIASACVLNNYLDRAIDKKMKRTSWRATATGKISTRAVFMYLGILGAVGFMLLIIFTNWLVVGLVALAYFSYIVLYGAAKRTTIHSTLIGTIPGGIPPVAGYAAVIGVLDYVTLLLFLAMVCWQMAHFYSIGMRRRDEYAAANLPVMPVVKGMHPTKVQILAYIAAFVVVVLLLVITSPLNFSFLAVMTILGFVWFFRGVRGFKESNDQAWAKRMFLFSLVVLLSFCSLLSIGVLLP